MWDGIWCEKMGAKSLSQKIPLLILIITECGEKMNLFFAFRVRKLARLRNMRGCCWSQTSNIGKMISSACYNIAVDGT